MSRSVFIRTVIIPIGIVVILGAGLAGLWLQSRQHHLHLLKSETAVMAEQTAARLEDAVKIRLELVNQIRREWLIAPYPDRAAFERRSLSLQRQFPGYQAVSWVDPKGVIRWVVPREPNIAAEDFDLHNHRFAAATFRRAETTGAIQVTPPLPLVQGGLGIASYFPIRTNGKNLGYLNGVFRIRPMVMACLHGSMLKAYSVRLAIEGRQGFANGVLTSPGSDKLAASAAFGIYGTNWVLQVAPSAAQVALARPELASALILLGLPLAVGVAWLFRTDQLRRVDLERSEERYRRLVEDSVDVIYVSTPGGRLLDINPAGVELFAAASREELLSVDVGRDLFVNPRQRRAFVERLHRDGSVRDYRLLLKTLEAREIVCRVSATVVRDTSGEVVAHRGILHDETEATRMQDQIIRMQRMESMSNLAGGIAHDFNNILAGILGYTSLLKMKLDDPDQRRQLEVIERSVDSATALTSQLLAFSRGDLRERRRVDLNEVVRTTLSFLRRTIDPSILIEPDLASDLPPVIGNGGQLQQVVLNLCLNARDAMPEGGILGISTSAEVGASNTGSSPADEVPSGFVRIAVSDTGHGMDATTRERIFEPFFSTKARNKGTGLGLAVVYGIVTGHGGTIEVDSSPNLGATFTVELPATTGAPETDESVEAAEGGGSGTILVVDDDATVRSALVEILESHGYASLQAEDGLQAVAVFEQHRHEIDLVILDMTMPHMGGRQTFDRLRDISPDVRVVLSTGYSRMKEGQKLLKEGARAFLQKPYRVSELLSVIHGILGDQ
ncbi:MAG: response regulator [Acidobacteria bacterium]|jgi:PAS domain S-box-containing protein|nr:response regulator [Acidobacteriota bacterium]